MYTLLALEALVALYFWELGLERETPLAWSGFVISSIFGLYTHKLVYLPAGLPDSYLFS